MEIKVKLLYTNLNGEKVGEYPSALRDKDAEWIYSWAGKIYQEGRFGYDLVATQEGLYIIETWIPKVGYVWEEEHIYKLLLPDEGE